MSEYFSRFPKMLYDVNRDGKTSRVVTTNILFRVAILTAMKHNGAAYFMYDIADHDTPEILAEKFYGTPEGHWVILLTNDIIDPQYDWPLNSEQFGRYIIDKYGSIALAQSTTHHTNRIVHRRDVGTSTDFFVRCAIDATNINSNVSVSLPLTPYDAYTSLPVSEPAGVLYTLRDGTQVTEAIYREAVTQYDFEFALNEAKRSIKIINPQYFAGIVDEFQRLTGEANPSLSVGYRSARI